MIKCIHVHREMGEKIENERDRFTLLESDNNQ